MLQKIKEIYFVNHKKIVFIYAIILIVSFLGVNKFLNQVSAELDYLLPSNHQLIKDTKKFNEKFLYSENTVLVIETEDGQSQKLSEIIKEKIESSKELDVKIVKNNFKEEINYIKENEIYFYPIENLINIFNKIYINKAGSAGRINEIGLGLKNVMASSRFDYYKDLQLLPDGYLVTPNLNKSLILIIHNDPINDIEEAKEFVVGLENILEGLKSDSMLKGYYLNSNAKNLISDYDSLWDDLLLSSSLMALFLSFILFLFFRSLKIIILINIPVILGVALTYGIVSFFLDVINSNTYFLSTMIVGNSVNVGVIFVANWYYEIVGGNDNRASQVENVFKKSIEPTFYAMISSLVIYSSLLIFDFKAYFDLGIIGILGMLSCWICYILFMPSFMLLDFIKDIDVAKIRVATIFKKFNGFNVNWKYGYILTFGIFVLGLYFSFFKYDSIFEKDLTKIRYENYTESSYDAFAKKMDGISVNKGMLPVASILFQDLQDLRMFRTQLHLDKDIYDLAPEIKSFSYDDIFPLDVNAKNGYINAIKNSGLIERMIDHPDVDRLEETILHQIKNTKKNLYSKEQVPYFFKTIFSSDSNKNVGDLLYLSFDLNRLEKDSSSMIKLFLKINEIKNRSKLNAYYVGVMPLMSTIQAEISDKWILSLGISFILVMITIYFSQSSFKVFIKLTGIYLLLIGVYLFILSVLNLKLNVLSFLSLLLTVGIGVDYSINLLSGHQNKVNLMPFVFLNCSVTLVSYFCLYIGTSQLALKSFGLMSIIGEILAITIAILFTKSIVSASK